MENYKVQIFMKDQSKRLYATLTARLLATTAVLLLLTATDAPAQIFSNNSSIAIGASGQASPYPSFLGVHGMTGTISSAPGSVKVRINNFHYGPLSGVDIVLVGPTGAALLLQSDAGSSALTSTTYTISDSAPSFIPAARPLMDGGVYRPTNYGANQDTFPAPAPTVYGNPGPGGGATFASVFGGTNPNGTWLLYVYADEGGNYFGAINGWSIIFSNGESDLYAPSKLSLGAGDGVDTDNFGRSVAVFGDVAVVGAPYDDHNGEPGRGAAYIFFRDSSGFWTPVQKLAAGDGEPGDRFGWSVAISGDTIVVGAAEDDVGPNGGVGAAYVFQNLNDPLYWSQQAKLTASDGAAGDRFGSAVAVAGNYIVVGAPYDDSDTIIDKGSAYVFARSGTVWSEQDRLIFSGAANDHFGHSVGISGTTVIVGAPYDDVGNNGNQGTARIFVRSGSAWNFQQTLTASDGGPGSQFGWSVDISSDAFSGTRVIVGAVFDNIGNNSQSGSAYTFFRPFAATDWTQEQKLTGDDPAPDNFFGKSVALSGNTAIVGAQAASGGSGPLLGAAYVFRRSSAAGWTKRRKLYGFDDQSTSNYGLSVALSGDTVFVGAPSDLVNGEAAVGSAYVFELDGRAFDFDNDWRTDISIFRPSNGEWWYQKSSNGGSAAAQFGSASDRIMPADFTGDGKTDVAFWRPSSGEWYILRSEDSSYYSFPFGANGDRPSTGDFDGDRKSDQAVFRPASGVWYVRRSSDGGTTIQGFGQNGDVPVPNDFDGDQRADIAVFRPSNGTWWIFRSASLSTIAFQFGGPADKPVPGDFTGDGKTDVAVFRPSSSEWFVLRSENQSYYSFPFGTNGDAPAPGDYDGDGKFDAAVFRPSNAVWYMQQTTNGSAAQQFGFSTDRPVPGAFVP